MGWKRINGRRYYYRSVREGGRVRTEYIGDGEAARLMAELAELRRQWDEAQRQARRAERDLIDLQEREFAAWFDRVETIANGAMFAAGYHRPKRKWRRRRMATNDTKNGTKPKSAREINTLLQLAQRGDESVLPQIRDLFANPDSAPVIREACGDPPRWARDNLLKLILGDNLLLAEAATRQMQDLAHDLAGPHPTPMERVLAERAALCWLTVHLMEARYASNKDGWRLEQGEYHQKQISRAHHRFLSALKTLATVRKLALPALQVNIAETQQVNTALGS